LKLHKALSEAEVECQKKFDAVKSFELGLLSSSTNMPKTLDEGDSLKKEERVAYDNREAARKALEDWLRQTA
jgi:hypothetical protein